MTKKKYYQLWKDYEEHYNFKYSNYIRINMAKGGPPI